MYNKHGLRYTSEYRVWHRLVDGSRKGSLEVTNKWMTIKGFLADMGMKPSPNHFLKRKDLDDGYHKDNCIWSTERGGRTETGRYYVEYRRKKKQKEMNNE